MIRASKSSPPRNVSPLVDSTSTRRRRFQAPRHRTCRRPNLANATMPGVVRAPSLFSMTRASCASMIATQEFVVPRSIAMTLLVAGAIWMSGHALPSRPGGQRFPPRPSPAEWQHRRRHLSDRAARSRSAEHGQGAWLHAHESILQLCHRTAIDRQVRHTIRSPPQVFGGFYGLGDKFLRAKLLRIINVLLGSRPPIMSLPPTGLDTDSQEASGPSLEKKTKKRRPSLPAFERSTSRTVGVSRRRQVPGEASKQASSATRSANTRIIIAAATIIRTSSSFESSLRFALEKARAKGQAIVLDYSVLRSRPTRLQRSLVCLKNNVSRSERMQL